MDMSDDPVEVYSSKNKYIKNNDMQKIQIKS